MSPGLIQRATRPGFVFGFCLALGGCAVTDDLDESGPHPGSAGNATGATGGLGGSGNHGGSGNAGSGAGGTSTGASGTGGAGGAGAGGTGAGGTSAGGAGGAGAGGTGGSAGSATGGSGGTASSMDPGLALPDPSGDPCMFIGSSSGCPSLSYCRISGPNEGRCESCDPPNCGTFGASCTQSNECDIIRQCYQGKCRIWCTLGTTECGAPSNCVDVGHATKGICITS